MHDYNRNAWLQQKSTVMHDSKLPKSFNSGRWKKTTTHLCKLWHRHTLQKAGFGPNPQDTITSTHWNRDPCRPEVHHIPEPIQLYQGKVSPMNWRNKLKTWTLFSPTMINSLNKCTRPPETTSLEVAELHRLHPRLNKQECQSL